jgi:CRISPR-associated protein Csc1
MHVTRCRLTLHENLFYATREIGRLYETGRYLHNYGLTYALGYAVAPYFNAAAVPRYAEDLSPLNTQQLYVTPARPIEVTFELSTFKYADNHYRVKMEPSGRNTPSFGRAKELAVGSVFEFAILSATTHSLPSWIRLGKWMSKAALQVTEQLTVKQQSTGSFVCAWPINLLDLPRDTKVLAYDMISMPPVSLLDRVHLSGSYLHLSDGSYVPAGLAYRFPKG